MKEPLQNTTIQYGPAVRAAQQGDQAGFRFLYEKTYREKLYIARKYMRNDEDAQDVLQDAYLKAWQNLYTLQDAEMFPGWLSMIVANTALNALKKKKPMLFSDLAKETEDGGIFEYEEADLSSYYQPEHTYTDQETSMLLREMIDSLSDEQRFCVLMYYVEDHSVGEIAGALGCPENTVKSRLHYGRKNLKAKADDLEKKGYSLYGFAAVPFLLTLMKTEAKAMSAVPAAASAVQETGRVVAGETAAKGGMAIGAKIAIAVLVTSLVGGTGFAAVRLLTRPVAGGGAAPVSEVASGDAGNTVPVPVTTPASGSNAMRELNRMFESLDPLVQQEFDALFAHAEQVGYGKWVYLDDDPYPELLVCDYSNCHEDDIPDISFYYGQTAELFEITGMGQTHQYELYGHAQGRGGQYYVPRKGIVIDDSIHNGQQIGDLTMRGTNMGTVVMQMTQPGILEVQYALALTNATGGGYAYYRLDYEGGSWRHSVITEEEYRALHYYEVSENLHEKGWPNNPPQVLW